MIPIDRLPPQNAEAEMAVIGAVLINPDALVEVTGFLQASDFYQDIHRTIFAAIVRVKESGRDIDAVTLTEDLRGRGLLEGIGGATYLSNLARSVPTSANIIHYAEIVRGHSVRRALIYAAEGIMGRAYDGEVDAAELAATSQNLLDKATERALGPGRLTEFGPATVLHWQGLHGARNEPQAVGRWSGFQVLDGAIGGFRPGEVGVIAARPGIGKSALGLALALNVARQEKAVCIYSPEMTLESLSERAVCSVAGIDTLLVRMRSLSEDCWSLGAETAVQNIGPLPIYVDDSPHQTTSSISATARRVKNLGLVVIDYLSLLADTQAAGVNLAQHLGTVTKRVKRIARTVNAPVILLSQLNRQLEARGGEPRLSDLRDSGAIEQDADWVLFLWLPAAEGEKAPPEGVIAAKIAKNRSGPTTGMFFLKWDPRFTRFSDAPEPMRTFAKEAVDGLGHGPVGTGRR